MTDEKVCDCPAACGCYVEGYQAGRTKGREETGKTARVIAAKRQEAVGRRMREMLLAGRMPHRTWEEVLGDARTVLRALVEEPPEGSESLRDHPLCRLADQVDRIHSDLAFRREVLGRDPETIGMPEFEPEETP